MIDDDKPRVYSIPENFIDESRIFKGMFKTRNFIEGLILGGISAIPALFIPAGSFNSRVMIITVFAAPMFLLGNNGYNGDPISTTIRNAKNWFSARGMMLYNTGTRALKEAPLTTMMEKPQAKEKILDLLDSIREERRKRTTSVEYIEGETFVFAEDRELAGHYVEENVSPTTGEEIPAHEADSASMEPPAGVGVDSADAMVKARERRSNTLDIRTEPRRSDPVEISLTGGNRSTFEKGGLF